MIDKEALEKARRVLSDKIDAAMEQYKEGGSENLLTLADVANCLEDLLEISYAVGQKDIKANKAYIYNNLKNLKEALNQFTPEYVQGSVENAKAKHKLNKTEVLKTLESTLPADMPEVEKRAKIQQISDEFDKAEASGDLYTQYAYTEAYQSVRSFATDVLLLGCLLR